MTDIHNEFQKSRFFHDARIDRRSADALTGLAAGLVADSVVTQSEAVFLKQWIEQNLTHLDDPVINLLYRRLSEMLADEKLDADESADLLEMLRSFSGLPVQEFSGAAVAAASSRPTDLPLCKPVPELQFEGKSFVFTGIMAFGPRKECQHLVVERGGILGGGVSKKVDYLIIGSIGNEQWLHTSYGAKILKAVELRDAGGAISIVSEDHWQAAIFR